MSQVFVIIVVLLLLAPLLTSHERLGRFSLRFGECILDFLGILLHVRVRVHVCLCVCVYVYGVHAGARNQSLPHLLQYYPQGRSPSMVLI